MNEQDFKDISFTADVLHGLPDVRKAVRNLERSFRSGGVAPIDDNERNARPKNSKKRRKPTKKKSASRRPKDSSNSKNNSNKNNNNNNNNKQQKTCNVDSSVPETLLQSLSTRLLR